MRAGALSPLLRTRSATPPGCRSLSCPRMAPAGAVPMRVRSASMAACSGSGAAMRALWRSSTC